MKKIFITRRLPSIAEELLSRHFNVSANTENKALSPAALVEAVSRCHGILCTVTDKFTKEILDKPGPLQVLSNYAAGLDNIDVQYAKSRGITVYNTPDVVTHSTADFTFALFLSLIRKISPAREFVKENKWTGWDPELFLGEELNGKIFGILGFGKIGRAVARRALGFGLRVIFYDPYVRTIEPRLDAQVTGVELEQLLDKSHYISIHASLTGSSRGIINREAIAKMSKQPVILNLARGGLVQTDALVEALEKGYIKGAVLDVTEPEPIPDHHPLCNFENCIVTPHIGTATKECRHNMAKMAAQNIIRYFSDKK